MTKVAGLKPGLSLLWPFKNGRFLCTQKELDGVKRPFTELNRPSARAKKEPPVGKPHSHLVFNSLLLPVSGFLGFVRLDAANVVWGASHQRFHQLVGLRESND